MLEIDSNFKRYPRREKTDISDEAKAERHIWSVNHENDPQDQWDNTWWTDECSVERGKGRKREWCWRHSGEAYLPQMQAKVPPKGVSIMIWVGMKRDGILVLRFPQYDPDSEKQGVTAKTYLEMVSDFLLEYYEPG